MRRRRQGCGLRLAALAASHARNRCPITRLAVGAHAHCSPHSYSMPPFLQKFTSPRTALRWGHAQHHRALAAWASPLPSSRPLSAPRARESILCPAGSWLALTDVCVDGHGPAADAHGRAGSHVYHRVGHRRAGHSQHLPTPGSYLHVHAGSAPPAPAISPSQSPPSSLPSSSLVCISAHLPLVPN